MPLRARRFVSMRNRCSDDGDNRAIRTQGKQAKVLAKSFCFAPLRQSIADDLSRSTMTSTLSTFMPVLDRTNYQQWSGMMKSYLMAQGQWAVIKTSKPTPTSITTCGEGEDIKDITITDMKEVIEFDEKNSKALGNIRLHLHYTIVYQYNDEDSTAELWDALSEKYGKPGLPSAFLEFKGAMNVTIPNNGDPSPALDKMLTHFIRLKEIKFEISDKVQLMMILAKAPPSMEVVVQALCRDKAKLESLMLSNLVRALHQSWETHTHQGGKNQQQANKLSVVKRANNLLKPCVRVLTLIGPSKPVMTLSQSYTILMCQRPGRLLK